MIDLVAWHELKLIQSNGRAQREYVRCVTLVADKMKCQPSNAWESEVTVLDRCGGSCRTWWTSTHIRNGSSPTNGLLDEGLLSRRRATGPWPA
jgi:hypothetical protein